MICSPASCDVCVVVQLSCLMTCHHHLKDSSLTQQSSCKEVLKWSQYILRRFLKSVETNRMVCLEALFWGNASDARKISMGYKEEKIKKLEQIR